jgi:hypothetical protein
VLAGLQQRDGVLPVQAAMAVGDHGRVDLIEQVFGSLDDLVDLALGGQLAIALGVPAGKRDDAASWMAFFNVQEMDEMVGM